MFNRFSDYDNIIFDFDGVVVDSNLIKEKCISEASKKFCEKNYHLQFVEYFVRNNGIPREVKINNYFPKSNATQILEKYNRYLSKQLDDVQLTKGLMSLIVFLNSCHKKLYVLSGGEQTEVINILKQKKIENFFCCVMGGPKTKEENLDENHIEGKAIFMGDSLKDYQVAEKYGFDFIFMYGYTQFKDWEQFFRNKNILMSLQDFTDLVKYKKDK
jgi:phosphoglycolate phosphatase-like HAD superfamily hydrolase